MHAYALEDYHPSGMSKLMHHNSLCRASSKIILQSRCTK